MELNQRQVHGRMRSSCRACNDQIWYNERPFSVNYDRERGDCSHGTQRHSFKLRCMIVETVLLYYMLGMVQKVNLSITLSLYYMISSYRCSIILHDLVDISLDIIVQM